MSFTLTFEEQSLLNGTEGPGVQRAMEIIATLGRIYGAPDLVPVSHAQIAGVSYKNLGDPGVAFLNEWADEGARVRVPTTLNPAGSPCDQSACVVSQVPVPAVQRVWSCCEVELPETVWTATVEPAARLAVVASTRPEPSGLRYSDSVPPAPWV